MVETHDYDRCLAPLGDCKWAREMDAQAARIVDLERELASLEDSAARAMINMAAELASLRAMAGQMAEALEACHEEMHKCTAVLHADDCAKVAAVMASARAALSAWTAITPSTTCKD